jgi:dTDP-4-dehydrorhamnose reductase
MILLLGASGYIGQAFESALQQREEDYRSLSRDQLDYTDFDTLRGFLESNRPAFLINCAGYTGKPNVDACESARSQTLLGNAMLPATVSHVCTTLEIPWGHVSSGCIYSGAKVRTVGDKGVRTERDLTRLNSSETRQPNGILGFTEEDIPNFSFRDPPCSFYSGSKALGEEALADASQCYIWRLRIPFNNVDNPRNYLTKLMRYDRLLDAENSISQLEEFVSATYACWQKRIPFGAYNVTNPGAVWSREVVEQILKSGVCKKNFSFFKSEAEFMSVAAKTPRSNCVMDSSKLEAAGVKLTPVSESIDRALRNWVPAS